MLIVQFLQANTFILNPQQSQEQSQMGTNLLQLVMLIHCQLYMEIVVKLVVSVLEESRLCVLQEHIVTNQE